MNKTFAILGLGKFGMSVARSLMRDGGEVLVADNSEEVINQISGEVTYAMTCDLTNADAIRDLGISNFDVVVVCMAQSFEASVMCVVVAKELGVPYVMAKASSHRTGDILKRIGADQIIYPEEETGIRIAKKLTSNDFLEFFDISENLCLIEMKVPKDWVGKTLMELDLRKRFKMNVVAVSDDNNEMSHMDPAHPLSANETLLVITEKKDLKKIRV